MTPEKEDLYAYRHLHASLFDVDCRFAGVAGGSAVHERGDGSGLHSSAVQAHRRAIGGPA